MASFLTCIKHICTAFLFLVGLINADALVLGDEKTEQPTSDETLIDHGVHGELFNVAEEDMIRVLMQRLNVLKESGKLDAFQKESQERARKAVLEPSAVSHITPTTKTRVFYVDPTLVIEGDIVLPEGIPSAGHVLAKKGDLINPLHTLKPQKGLLFIDGDDASQQQLAVKLASIFDVVLVKGKPIALEESLQIPIFFDQGGIITKRYGINHVPAKMEIEGDRLKFTEFKVTETDA